MTNTSRPAHWTRLTWPVGNNAFAYEQRITADPDPKLRIPPVKQISTIDEIALGTFPTFAECDDHGDVVTYTGLEYIYQMDILPFCTDEFLSVPMDAWICVPTKYTDVLPYIPTYIFDNHNYALYFWATHCLANQWTDTVRPYVIHIDQHSDLAGNPHPFPGWETIGNETLFHYTTRQCNVGNFIQPILDAGLISSCIWIKNQYDLEHTPSPKSTLVPLEGRGLGWGEKYILDIDLDFWAPEMGTDPRSTIPMVRDLMREASCITIATSPYFLDQPTAIQLLYELFNWFN